MKSLNTLIKLHKQQLDALRRSMAPLEEKKAQLLQKIEALKDELKREIALAEKQPEMSGFYGDFAKAIRLREEKMKVEIAVLDQQMEKLREDIREKFGELKKYEIAREQQLAREKEKQRKRENEQMDEVAITQFARKDG